ncbi:uncharacterized protein Rcd7 [Ochlerotatus camptorhynchus]|uniref:uncharacterized protein Rcd7 n=1 Tax=Ochlerotatus camptorhynchus TaxID=644619 RepID=UPI0031E02EB8
MDESSQNSSELLLFDKSTEVVLYPELFAEEPPSLEAEIKRGIKESRQRQRKARKEKRKARRSAQKETPKITKIVFSAPAKFRGCRHNETIVIDREILNPAEHIRLLATPRAKPKPQYFRLVRKTIPAATNHIRTLAQPKAYYVEDTLKLHAGHLKPHQVERMNERLTARDYLTIPESRQFARQQKRDERRWLRHRERQARMLKKKIVRLELAYLRDIMEKAYRQNRSYFLDAAATPPQDELAIASEVILTRICQLIGVDVPRRNGGHVLDKYYCQLGDEAAKWMWHIMQSSGVTFERPEDVEKRLSAASSIFEDQTKLRQGSEGEEWESEEEDDSIKDETTKDIVTGMLESCIAAAVLALHDVESHTTYGSNFVGAQSVSQTAVRSVPSEETTKTEREKGSKVNFVPRTSSIAVDLSRSVVEREEGEQDTE